MKIHEVFAYLRVKDAARAIDYYKAAFGVTEKLHVDNADEVLRRAVAEGGTLVREPVDHFYGERSGTVRDPFGHEWNIGHSIEGVTPEEMQRRYTALMKA
jgi:uncharacterized glyoxalase superfamily protein PhnB